MRRDPRRLQLLPQPALPEVPGSRRAPQWLADRRAELLPVPYFHVVFTVPAPLAAIALQNKAVVYDILFKAAAETIRTIGADPKHLGAETGMIADPAHLGADAHASPACPLRRAGRRDRAGRTLDHLPPWLLPARPRPLASLPPPVPRTPPGGLRGRRADLLQRSRQAARAGRLRRALSNRCARSNGSSMPNARSADPQQVLDYLGRYTHRVAIANSRLLALREWPCPLSLEGLPRQQQVQGDDARCRRVHPPLPAACAAEGLPPHPPLRLPGKRLSDSKLAHIRTALNVPKPAATVEPADYRERYAMLTGIGSICARSAQAAWSRSLAGRARRRPHGRHHAVTRHDAANPPLSSIRHLACRRLPPDRYRLPARAPGTRTIANIPSIGACSPRLFDSSSGSTPACQRRSRLAGTPSVCLSCRCATPPRP